MFHSETLARVIHADRVRDLERAAELHRLVTAEPTDHPTPVTAEPATLQPVVVAACPSDDAAPRIDGSTGLAA